MRWFFMLPVSLVITVIAYIGAPLWAVFANKEGHYPKWLSWLTTPDALADGDTRYRNEYGPYPGPQVGWKRYVNRVVWMMRNPGYGFDWGVMSYLPTEPVVVRAGKHPVNGSLVHGWYFATSGYAWQIYITFHWNKTYCTKINIGWKLWMAPERCQFVFSPGLMKRIS